MQTKFWKSRAIDESSNKKLAEREAEKTQKIKFIWLGLEINPKHVGINEYLGELYVATNRIDLAKERLKILESCNCEEYTELKEVIDGTKKSKY